MYAGSPRRILKKLEVDLSTRNVKRTIEANELEDEDPFELQN